MVVSLDSPRDWLNVSNYDILLPAFPYMHNTNYPAQYAEPALFDVGQASQTADRH